MNTAPSSGQGDRIVWIDCEMTGLSLVDDALIEIAVIVTDSELHALHPGFDIVIAPPAEALANMGEVVTTMHTTSGLLEDLPGGTTLADAQAQVLDYIKQFVPDPGKAPLAGNSVGTDKGFLERDMPELVAHLHYRIIDVSSLKELARRWYPRAYFNSPKKNGGHRALADIAESIDELRYYRSVLLPEGVGPDSATAKRKAEVIAASPTLAAAPADASAPAPGVE
ncbi:oligoribonuclease [Ruania zhangjianzhongii]|uniref:oligoribonuclease n=1 Tax=Ruania zhangjianzhongii TaxID=2603206 RepID=UPI0022A88352|nr:oligoribonuclease [Ruania zhangjianzhongii]